MSEDAALANRTTTQARNSELLEEVRAARRQRDAYRLAAQILSENLSDAIAIIDGLTLRLAKLEHGSVVVDMTGDGELLS